MKFVPPESQKDETLRIDSLVSFEGIEPQSASALYMTRHFTVKKLRSAIKEADLSMCGFVHHCEAAELCSIFERGRNMACAHGNDISHTLYLSSAAELLAQVGLLSPEEAAAMIADVKSARAALLEMDIHRATLESVRGGGKLVISTQKSDALKALGLTEEQVIHMEQMEFHQLFTTLQRSIALPIEQARDRTLELLRQVA